MSSWDRFDTEAVLREARAKLSFRTLLTQHGHGPRGDGGGDRGWKAFPCPFCGKRSSGLFPQGGIEKFKCFRKTCPTAGLVLDDIEYLALVTHQSRKEAF